VPVFEKFNMPDAGEGLTEAEVVVWHVSVGDRVEVNQPLLEIETAKSLVELPCPFAGVVTELLADIGQVVEVGAPIVVIDVDPDGAPDQLVEPLAVTEVAAAALGQAVPRPPAEETPRTSVPIADLEAANHAGLAGSGIEGGVADDAAAAAGAGAAGAAGSGAVLVGYGVSAAGSARRPRVGMTPIDADLPVVSTAPSASAAPAAPMPPALAATAPSASAALAAPAPAAHTHPVLAKPPVRKLARDLNIDLSSVTPTGPGGIVTREDVLAHVERSAAAVLATYPGDEMPWLDTGTVSADGRQTRVPVKSVRKRTAEAVVSSAFSAPHVTVFQTIDVSRTMRLVEKLRNDKEFADVRVTPLLIAAKALVLAVRRHPEINASWDDERQEIVYKHYVNLGIAAATPRGLVVPNIKDAHRLGLHTLAVEIANLTATARAGRTSPADLSDGTITITNVGVFGIDTGTPILNPGEAGILAFGAIRQQPWVHKGKVRSRWVTQLALSFDHRLADGELGSRVLADVAAILGDPAQGLVWG
jgi:2-oxoisovalerate dehydrogenase E2 component (dihydrolipoyl transacylase)